MKQQQIDRYVRMEERERAAQARDFTLSDGAHPMTMGWERYHRGEQRTPVRNMDGRIVLLTPNQYIVYRAAKQLEGQKVSASIIANSLGFATSTVTRALQILAAFKLVAYDVETGRYGGITFLRLAWADLKRRSQTAWGDIKATKRRAWDRFQRKLERSHYFSAGLDFNVATITSMDATLNAGAS